MTEELVAVLVVALVMGGAALLVRAVGRAAARGRLGPNQVGGMRTPATMASPEAWRAAHQAALPWSERTAMACLLLTAVAVAVAVAGYPDWGFGLVLAAALVMLAGTVYGAVVGHRVAKQVRDGGRTGR